MGWIDEFITSFLRGAAKELYLLPPTEYHSPEPMQRPTQKQFQEYVSRHINRLDFHRTTLEFRGESYYVMDAYIRSAVYTIIYDRKQKRSPRFKVVQVLPGRAEMRDVREGLVVGLRERRWKADRAATRWGLKQRRG